MKLRDYKMIEKAIESDGTLIRYIGNEIHDENLVKKAVSQNGMSLQYVSGHQTPEVIKAAISQNVMAIQYARFFCIDFCDIVLKSDKTAMKYVNPDFFSKEIIAYLLSFDDDELVKLIPLKRLDKFIQKEVLNLK